MKKLILISALALVSSFTFAQEANVKKAKKVAKSFEPDLAKATSLINLALNDESSKNLSSTWYVKGFIEYRKFEIENEKRFDISPETKPDENIQSKAAYNAYKDWIIADSLDIKESISNPKRKGKLEYRRDITSQLNEMKVYIANYGLMLFNNKKFEESKKVFEDLTLMPSLEMFKDSKDIKVSDTLFIESENNIRVSMIQIFNKQKADKDTVAFLKTLQEGTDKFPNELFFLSKMIDYNVSMNKEKEALESINKALLVDDKNAVLYFLRGFIYSMKEDQIKQAYNDFAKAAEINPDFVEAIYQYGSLIFKEADEAYKASILMRNQSAADAKMNEANELYKKSIPYFEKVRAMNTLTNDRDEMLRKLQAAYYKLKMLDKSNEIKAVRGM